MKFKDFPTNVRLRLVCGFFIRIVGSAIFPFMALYFSAELGKIAAGLIMTSFVIVGYVTGLFGGYFSDRFNRKHVLQIGQIAQILCFIGMTVAIHPSNNWALAVAVLYFGHAISNGLNYPALEAIVIDSMEESNRKAIYVYDYWLVNLAIAGGVMLGGLFYRDHRFALFVGMTLVLLITTIVLQRFLVDSYAGNRSTPANPIVGVIQNYRIALADRRWMLFVLGSMLVFSTEFHMANYIGVHLAETFQERLIAGVPFDGVRMMAFMQLENTLLVVAITFAVTAFVKRFREKHVFFIGLALYVTAFAAITSMNSFFILAVLAIVFTLGELLYSPIRQVKQVDLLDPERRASYLAFGGLTFHGAKLVAAAGIVVGAFIGPVLMSGYIFAFGALGGYLYYVSLYKMESVRKLAA
ncbi:MFS transporter [Exiguobacterium aurantiacum]|uniref:Multidrug resistance protein MdtH n=1 Tax=Exiguobacterium aurantiacum TaxID=33987 RepID=A0A377FXE8_9BACL|nr:MFS transporter [Exiguobacterium aurantiacum]STO08973.1 Multidrug resistance protein MdtH [Exiguobacterium aurantiacum]